MNLPFKNSTIMVTMGAIVVAGVASAMVLSRNSAPALAPVVTQQDQQQAAPVAKTMPVDQTTQQPIDRSGGGDFGIIYDDFVVDPAHTAHSVGRNLEITTAEGYRVSLVLPPNNTYNQDVTLSALKKSPFPATDIPNQKGSGVWVEPKYSGLSGRPFYDPAWLVFEFAPAKRTYDKKQPRNFCRPDYPEFNPVRCLNQTGSTIQSDGMLTVNIDVGGKMKAKLVPTFKIADNVYAVAVLYGGVYAPFKPTADNKQQVLALAEMTASTTLTEPSGYLEAVRALQALGLTPGEQMTKKLQELPTANYVGLFWQTLGLVTAEQYHVSGMEAVAKRLNFRSLEQKRWAEYFSSVALFRRSYPTIKNLPEMFSADIQQALTSKINQNPPTKVAAQNVQYYHQRVQMLDAFGELRQWYEWSKTQVANAEPQFRLAVLRELILSPVFAQSSLSPQEYYDALGRSLQDMVNNTGCDAAGRSDLLVIASIAFQWDHEDVGDGALEKLKGCLADAIDKAAAPEKGGSGSGGGTGDTSGGTSGCDLVHKDLSNFGMNSCSGAAGTLLDLAKEASRIEEDGLANAALQKAGVL